MEMNQPDGGTERSLDEITIGELKAMCRDKIFIPQVRDLLIETGIFEALDWQVPATRRDPLPVIPDKFTAIQFGVFDNGDQRDRRGRERATKTRWGLSVKCWIDESPDWRKPDFNSNISLWSRSFAEGHVSKLYDRGAIGHETLAMIAEVNGQLDDSWFIGLSKSKTSGTRYLDGSVFALRVNDGVADAILAMVNGELIFCDELARVDASGRALTNNAVAMARLSDALEEWRSGPFKPNS